MLCRSVVSAAIPRCRSSWCRAALNQPARWCSQSPTTGAKNASSVNHVTLVGVAHDIQTGYVFEDAVTQFTLTTTSVDSTATGESGDCVVEKDHHTVRCFGDVFSQEMKTKVKEGCVLCVSGRLRLNPQLEPSVNKYYYFPFIHVQPPHGQVAVLFEDHKHPSPTGSEPASETVSSRPQDAPQP